MPDPIRVILVDDQSLVRSGFRMLIESEDDMEVVSEASNGLEALDVLRRMPVDVALMDIRMPLGDGLAAAERILAEDEGARIVFLTTFSDDEYIVRADRKSVV